MTERKTRLSTGGKKITDSSIVTGKKTHLSTKHEIRASIVFFFSYLNYEVYFSPSSAYTEITKRKNSRQMFEKKINFRRYYYVFVIRNFGQIHLFHKVKIIRKKYDEIKNGEKRK